MPFYGRMTGFFLCDGHLRMAGNCAKFRRFSKGNERDVTFYVEQTVQIVARWDKEVT